MNDELKARIESIKNVNLNDFCVDFDHKDIIDSRDIQEKIDEFTGEFESLLDDIENAEGEEAIQEAEDNLEGWLDENEDEYVSLMAFKEECEQYTSEWKYGAEIIHEDYFLKYAEDLAYDTGAVNRKATWPISHIDWKAAAEELQCDYAFVTFNGNGYWVR